MHGLRLQRVKIIRMMRNIRVILARDNNSHCQTQATIRQDKEGAHQFWCLSSQAG